MSRRYIRKTEFIDKERGDALTLRKQDVEALFAPEYPSETRRDILEAFIGWFAGAEAPTLDNPLADAFLQTLVCRQKESARRYLEFCKVRVENRSKQEKKRQVPTRDGNIITPQVKDGATSADMSRHMSSNINKTVNKVKEKDGNLFSFTVGDEVSRADAVTPSPLSVAEAKKELMILAPPVSNERYSEDDLKYYEECRDEDYGDEEATVDHALDVIGETESDKSRNALAKFCAAVGLNLFRRAVFRFDTDLFQDEKKGGKEKSFRSKGAALVARLKRLSAAVDALDEETLDAVDATGGGEAAQEG